jgi:hypothetical protein
VEAGRRSARAALAEMASQNARLVSAFSAKKEEARSLRAEVGTKHTARNVIVTHLSPRFLNSVSGPVSKVWYRIPFDQSELSISKISPTDSPTVRPGGHP